jgi:hypothetical protein
MSEVFECKHTVCDENANTIHKHTRDPETYIFAIGLVSAVLCHHIEAAAEYEECMKQSIE